MQANECKELARKLERETDSRSSNLKEYRRLGRWTDEILGNEDASPTQRDNADSYEASMRRLDRHVNESSEKIKAIKKEMREKRCQ